MGYRTYIGEMPKREYNKIKVLDEKGLIGFYNIEVVDVFDGPDYWYKGVYEYGKSLHEFGKYTGFAPPKGSIKPFFKNKELMKRYDEHDFYVATPEFLIYVIEGYKQRVKDYYSKMVAPFYQERWDTKSELIKTAKRSFSSSLDDTYEFDFTKATPEEQTQMMVMFEHMRSMWLEWTSKNISPVDTELKNNIVSASWKYEYAIFELTHILKTFDWKRKVMLYYGY